MLHVDEQGPTDLESRVNARRDQLIAQLISLKNETGLDAIAVRKTIKVKLTELGHLVKAGVVDGWTNIDDAVRHHFDSWLGAERPITCRAPDTD